MDFGWDDFGIQETSTRSDKPGLFMVLAFCQTSYLVCEIKEKVVFFEIIVQIRLVVAVSQKGRNMFSLKRKAHSALSYNFY